MVDLGRVAAPSLRPRALCKKLIDGEAGRVFGPKIMIRFLPVVVIGSLKEPLTLPHKRAKACL
jgi:hypothetical protein